VYPDPDVIFAIGDVHGCAAELRVLIDKLPITPETTVVFLGDYIDRGPDSRAVIEMMMELSERCSVIPLLGNHEEMFRAFLEKPTSALAAGFIYNGGSATLASYADARGEVTIPEHHLAFLDSLRLFHETESHVFVHAGLPQVPLTQIDPVRDRQAMLWMRGRFLTTEYDWGKVVVHGHTVVAEATILPNRINLDTGCVFDRRLTAIALPGQQLITVRRTSRGPRVILRDPSSRRAAARFQGVVPVWVRRGDVTYAFETIDYSELGMHLRTVGGTPTLSFDVGDPIDGLIGTDETTLVEFSGAVVRRMTQDDGVHYGVKIFVTRAVTASRAP
jgi:serine/threonine protein phosphatase 1